MAATPELAAILRDARKGALLRMRSEIFHYFSKKWRGVAAPFFILLPEN
jgi:hypothetical protein